MLATACASIMARAEPSSMPIGYELAEVDPDPTPAASLSQPEVTIGPDQLLDAPVAGIPSRERDGHDGGRDLAVVPAAGDPTGGAPAFSADAFVDPARAALTAVYDFGRTLSDREILVAGGSAALAFLLVALILVVLVPIARIAALEEQLQALGSERDRLRTELAVATRDRGRPERDPGTGRYKPRARS